MNENINCQLFTIKRDDLFFTVTSLTAETGEDKPKTISSSREGEETEVYWKENSLRSHYEYSLQKLTLQTFCELLNIR